MTLQCFTGCFNCNAREREPKHEAASEEPRSTGPDLTLPGKGPTPSHDKLTIIPPVDDGQTREGSVRIAANFNVVDSPPATPKLGFPPQAKAHNRNGSMEAHELGLVGPVPSLTAWQSYPPKKVDRASSSSHTLSPALSMISSVNSGIADATTILDDVLPASSLAMVPERPSQRVLHDSKLVSSRDDKEEDEDIDGTDPEMVDMSGLKHSEVKLGSIIGLGSYGKVYKGTARGVKVAVKVIAHAISASLEEMDAAEKEAVLAAQLQHPNMVHTYAIYRLPVSGTGAFQNQMRASTTELQTHLVMEYCNQGTLRAALDNNIFICPFKKRPNAMQITQVALDIAEAMLYMHSNDLVHRDLKSANIMLHRKSADPDEPLLVKVADFGLSKIVPQEGAVMNSRIGTLTHTAPEVLQGQPTSKCTDVYAFGVILWELYTSKHPYHNMRPFDVILAKAKARTAESLPLPPHCPRTYVQLCWDCWADVGRRPNMEEVVDRLVQLLPECSELAARRSVDGYRNSGGYLSDGDRRSTNNGKISLNLIGMIKPSPRSSQNPFMLTSNLSFNTEDCLSPTQPNNTQSRLSSSSNVTTPMDSIPCSRSTSESLVFSRALRRSSTGTAMDGVSGPRSSLEYRRQTSGPRSSSEYRRQTSGNSSFCMDSTEIAAAGVASGVLRRRSSTKQTRTRRQSWVRQSSGLRRTMEGEAEEVNLVSPEDSPRSTLDTQGLESAISSSSGCAGLMEMGREFTPQLSVSQVIRAFGAAAQGSGITFNPGVHPSAMRQAASVMPTQGGMRPEEDIIVPDPVAVRQEEPGDLDVIPIEPHHTLSGTPSATGEIGGRLPVGHEAGTVAGGSQSATASQPEGCLGGASLGTLHGPGLDSSSKVGVPAMGQHVSVCINIPDILLSSSPDSPPGSPSPTATTSLQNSASPRDDNPRESPSSTATTSFQNSAFPKDDNPRESPSPRHRLPYRKPSKLKYATGPESPVPQWSVVSVSSATDLDRCNDFMHSSADFILSTVEDMSLDRKDSSLACLIPDSTTSRDRVSQTCSGLSSSCQGFIRVTLDESCPTCISSISSAGSPPGSQLSSRRSSMTNVAGQSAEGVGSGVGTWSLQDAIPGSFNLPSSPRSGNGGSLLNPAAPRRASNPNSTVRPSSGTPTMQQKLSMMSEADQWQNRLTTRDGNPRVCASTGQLGNSKGQQSRRVSAPSLGTIIADFITSNQGLPIAVSTFSTTQLAASSVKQATGNRPKTYTHSHTHSPTHSPRTSKTDTSSTNCKNNVQTTGSTNNVPTISSKNNVPSTSPTHPLVFSMPQSQGHPGSALASQVGPGSSCKASLTHSSASAAMSHSSQPEAAEPPAVSHSSRPEAAAPQAVSHSSQPEAAAPQPVSHSSRPEAAAPQAVSHTARALTGQGRDVRSGAYSQSGQSSGAHSQSGQSSGAHSQSGQSTGAYSQSGQSAGAYSQSGQSSRAYSQSGQSAGAHSQSGQSSGPHSQCSHSSSSHSHSGHSSGPYSQAGPSSGTHSQPKTSHSNTPVAFVLASETLTTSSSPHQQKTVTQPPSTFRFKSSRANHDTDHHAGTNLPTQATAQQSWSAKSTVTPMHHVPSHDNTWAFHRTLPSSVAAPADGHTSSTDKNRLQIQQPPNTHEPRHGKEEHHEQASMHAVRHTHVGSTTGGTAGGTSGGTMDTRGGHHARSADSSSRKDADKRHESPQRTLHPPVVQAAAVHPGGHPRPGQLSLNTNFSFNTNKHSRKNGDTPATPTTPSFSIGAKPFQAPQP